MPGTPARAVPYSRTTVGRCRTADGVGERVTQGPARSRTRSSTRRSSSRRGTSRRRRRPGHGRDRAAPPAVASSSSRSRKPKKASRPARARQLRRRRRGSSRTRSSTRSARRSRAGASRATRTPPPITRDLLAHWRAEDRERRLFFCQIEAAETAIYLTEAAEKLGDTKALNVIRAENAAPQRRPAAARLQDGDRLGQDRRHGDAHRLAGAQQAGQPVRQAVQRPLPRRHARASRSATACASCCPTTRQLLPRDGPRHARAARPPPGGDDRRSPTSTPSSGARRSRRPA